MQPAVAMQYARTDTQSMQASPRSVASFERSSWGNASKRKTPPVATPLPTPSLLPSGLLAAVTFVTAAANRSSISAYMDNFEWKPEDAIADVWRPIALVTVWALTLLMLSHFGLQFRFKSFEVVHNAALTVFSVATTIGVLVAAHSRAKEDGSTLTLFCTPRSDERMWNGPLGFWTYLYYQSKFWELIDTVILVARGKKAIPLQLWHHGSMPFVTLSWFAFPWLEGAWWCVFTNSVIHSFMYYYYFQTTLGNRVWWKKYLTALQIIQFCAGMASCALYIALKSGAVSFGQAEICGGNYGTAALSVGVNCSFLLMFSSFFRKTYAKQAAAKRPVKNKSA
jgi:fatty acid elongase 3